MIPTILTIAVLCVGVGLIVLQSNPRRFANQVFAGASVAGALWLWSVAEAMHFGAVYARDHAHDPAWWLRLNAALAVFFPWIIFLQGEAVCDGRRDRALKRSAPGLLVSLGAAALCWTDAFLPVDSSPEHPRRGPLYFVVFAIGAIVCAFVFARMYRQTARQTGIRRVEMQCLALNLGVTFPLVTLLTTSGNLLHFPALKYASFFALLVSFGVGGWAFTLHRVHNAQQILISLAQRVALIGALAGMLWAAAQLLHGLVPYPLDLFLRVAVCFPAALWLDRSSRRWLDLGEERRLFRLRTGLLEIARSEPDPEHMAAEFERLLAKDAKAESARLLLEGRNAFGNGALELPNDQAGLAVLVQDSWATPDSLERRPDAAATANLAAYMACHQIGLLLAVPPGSPRPSLIVALGVKRSRWPYTHPEIQRLQSGAIFVDNMLVRSRLTSQQALKTKLEHLAMLSRGLAHDLKNLITPISSYLVHTADRQVAGSAEAEVHSAARRSVAVITEYVNEALFFAKSLTPRMELVRIGDVMRAVLEVTQARAQRRAVRVVISTEDPPEIYADAVLLQRLLLNLTGNAIDASSAGQQVVISARGAAQRLRIEVTDDGVGIARENAARIFEPYFTTKNFGDDPRGFGLGLTISEKIVALHHGTISVASEVGRGTRVTVELPIQPSDPALKYAAEAAGRGEKPAAPPLAPDARVRPATE